MKKEKKALNSIALLFFMIVAAAILTHIIPAGQYARVEIDGRMTVNPASFSFIKAAPASLFDILVAVPSGMTNAVSLIVGALLIGGGLECIQSSGALNIGISRIIKKVGLNRGNIILIFLFYVFALMGGFLGFVEGSIPFIPIAVSIAVGLGYDSIVGVAIAVVGAISGFSCGPTNPYTVAVAQTLAGLDIYSGLPFRVIMFLIIPAVCLLYILRYAGKVKKHPEKSLVAHVDNSDLAFDAASFDSKPFIWKHGVILLVLLLGIGTYVYGAVNWKWGFNELGAIFLLTGIVACVLGGMGVNETADTFIKGSSGMTGACFIMGVAYGISWIFVKASVLDTIVYYLSKPLTGLSSVVSLFGILIVIMLINLFIPSGSGKALIVMPIVLPIASIVGIHSQIAILAYQFGDGITNLCTPLLGVLLLALGFGKVPFSRWERFIMPLIAVLFILACIFLIIAMKIGYR